MPKHNRDICSRTGFEWLSFAEASRTVGCDQVTKVPAHDTLSAAGSLSYFNNTIVLVHAENTGAFLSAGAGLHEELRFLLFVLFSGALVVGALVYLIRKSEISKWHTIAIALFVGGGLGNLMDRMGRGSVTDFINLGIGSWRTGILTLLMWRLWPAF